MGKSVFRVIWTDEAKSDLKEIFDFLKKKSPQGAKNVIKDIRTATQSVHFPDQNEVEEYNKSYRRIVVRNYKLLYRIELERKELVVFSVFDSRQNPDKLSEK